MPSRALLVLSVCCLAATAAHADVDYEDQTVGPVPGGTALTFPGPLFIRAIAPTEIADGVACAPSCPDNGSLYQKTSLSGITGQIMVLGISPGLPALPTAIRSIC